jgi:hypothetical protein
MHKAQRLINHVALVLDGSSSMRGHKDKLIKVADEQIRHLALRSEELSQETRVSVYLFADNVQCLIFDMDVMRLPSIEDLYHANGMTALIDATIKSQEDLKTTSQLYGDHAFLTFVLTDGMENVSKTPWTTLSRNLMNASDNWTVAFLVPDRQGVAYVERLGADKGNIAVWDTTSASGIVDAVSTIRTATDNFMTNRAAGVRGTRSVFSTGKDAVNKNTVSNLKPLRNGEYALYDVGYKTRIDDFVMKDLGMRYVKGMGYYQLTKTENIQPQKQIIIVEKATGKAYSGREARQIIGLPETGTVRVKPDYNPEYDIFVQSTSFNRNLVPNTRVLLKS